jgi:cytochrome c oxidase assembly protein subunit 15
MVKSGLVNDVTVSHYRLSLHLSIAIIIISSIFWLSINIYRKKMKSFFKFSNEALPYQFLIILIFLQIIMGAFVSGLDAGKIYQSWPLMGNTYVPNDISLNNYQNYFEFSNHSLVQFYHRNLAYIIILYIFLLGLNMYKKKLYNLYKPIKILFLVLLIQIILGILTLLSNLNIYLASAHQITSVMLIFSAINLYYFNTK